ncbi:MAG: pilus assembly PilX N-terminal domain-containing protein [Deltaproteobacteria bacterium]|nr:pilus assembly PilX N-terminal domain-containing protein [Deltaproteobacteria bacterium]
MQKITSITNNQQGSVIIMAVMILALLSIIGIAATNTSTTEMKITTNGLLHNMAFYTADSGIAAGRAALSNLKMADRGSWDVLLFNLDAADADKQTISWNGADCTSLNDIIDADGGRTVGRATFTLAVRDNDDRDNSPEVDSDDTVFLTSTVSYLGSNVTIETIVQGGAGGGAYAQEHYDAGSTGEASSESAVPDSVQRW